MCYKNKKVTKSLARRNYLGNHIGERMVFEAMFRAISRPTLGNQSELKIELINITTFDGRAVADHLWIDAGNLISADGQPGFECGNCYKFAGTPYAYYVNCRNHCRAKYSVGNVALINSSQPGGSNIPTAA